MNPFDDEMLQMATRGDNLREMSFQNVLDKILKPAGVKVGGFPEDMFLDLSQEEQEKWICNICYLILKDAVECDNKHLFCETCIFAWTLTYGENSQTCPVCRSEQKNKYKEKKDIDKELSEKRVRCPEKGCVFRSPLRVFLIHSHGKLLFSNEGIDLESLRPTRPPGGRFLLLHPGLELQESPLERAQGLRDQLAQGRTMIHQMMLLLHLEMELRQQALVSYARATSRNTRIARLDEVLALNEQLNEVGEILSGLLGEPLDRRGRRESPARRRISEEETAQEGMLSGLLGEPLDGDRRGISTRGISPGRRGVPEETSSGDILLGLLGEPQRRSRRRVSQGWGNQNTEEGATLGVELGSQSGTSPRPHANNDSGASVHTPRSRSRSNQRTVSTGSSNGQITHSDRGSEVRNPSNQSEPATRDVETTVATGTGIATPRRDDVACSTNRNEASTTHAQPSSNSTGNDVRDTAPTNRRSRTPSSGHVTMESISGTRNSSSSSRQTSTQSHLQNRRTPRQSGASGPDDSHVIIERVTPLGVLTPRPVPGTGDRPGIGSGPGPGPGLSIGPRVGPGHGSERGTGAGAGAGVGPGPGLSIGSRPGALLGRNTPVLPPIVSSSSNNNPGTTRTRLSSNTQGGGGAGPASSSPRPGSSFSSTNGVLPTGSTDHQNVMQSLASPTSVPNGDMSNRDSASRISTEQSSRTITIDRTSDNGAHLNPLNTSTTRGPSGTGPNPVNTTTRGPSDTGPNPLDTATSGPSGTGSNISRPTTSRNRSRSEPAQEVSSQSVSESVADDVNVTTTPRRSFAPQRRFSRQGVSQSLNLGFGFQGQQQLCRNSSDHTSRYQENHSNRRTETSGSRRPGQGRQTHRDSSSVGPSRTVSTNQNSSGTGSGVRAAPSHFRRRASHVGNSTGSGTGNGTGNGGARPKRPEVLDRPRRRSEIMKDLMGN